MRIFIGLSLSQQERYKLHSYVANLRTAYPGAKWTTINNYHLTLCFLGKITHDALKKVIMLVEEVAYNSNSFCFYINKLNYISQQKNKIYVAHIAEVSLLEKLHKRIYDALKAHNFLLQQGFFVPHVTLAEVRGDVGRIPHIVIDPLKVVADKVTVYESQPKHGISHYTIVDTFPFSSWAD